MLAPLTACALVALSLSVTPYTQATSFAGRWTTDPDPTAAPAAAGTGGGAARGQGGGQANAQRGGGRGDMGSGWGSTITIAQDAAKLTVDYAFFSRGDMQPNLKFVYALDGTETKNSVMMGRGMQVQVSRTAWDGAKLVITTLHTLADPSSGKPVMTEVKQVLSLETPTSLVVETTRAGAMGGPATVTKTTYRKIA